MERVASVAMSRSRLFTYYMTPAGREAMKAGENLEPMMS